MATVRDFLGAFAVAAVILMALISFVLVGTAMMNEFVSLADLGNELIASAILAVVLAVPMAAVGTSTRDFDFIGGSAA